MIPKQTCLQFCELMLDQHKHGVLSYLIRFCGLMRPILSQADKLTNITVLIGTLKTKTFFLWTQWTVCLEEGRYHPLDYTFLWMTRDKINIRKYLKTTGYQNSWQRLLKTFMKFTFNTMVSRYIMPSQFAIIWTKVLKEELIGRRVNIDMHPRSPDITPTGFSYGVPSLCRQGLCLFWRVYDYWRTVRLHTHSTIWTVMTNYGVECITLLRVTLNILERCNNEEDGNGFEHKM